jgi:2,3,4,5-tetrahydropyridine-2-carboxylate N-succinyltransferase
LIDVALLRDRIDAAFDSGGMDAEAVEEAIQRLDQGEVRSAEPGPGGWTETIEVGPIEYRDKIPLKHGFEAAGARVVPPGVARYGSFLSQGVVQMPSFVNIGAWVGPDTMVDTWATVGSCAQVGARVHLAGGVGIGGVLEPVNARPVIIEDDCFVGSRAIVTEGVIVRERAILGANVVLTGSTPVVDVTGPARRRRGPRVPDHEVPGRRVRRRHRPDHRLERRSAGPEGQPEPGPPRPQRRDLTRAVNPGRTAPSGAFGATSPARGEGKRQYVRTTPRTTPTIDTSPGSMGL